MTHNPLDWKIFAGETSFSVYYDHPAEGFWFSNHTEAEKFRRALADDPNLDPLTTYWNTANS